MTLYYLRSRSKRNRSVDDIELYNGLHLARMAAVCVAEMTEQPVQIISDWDSNVVETIEPPIPRSLR